MARELLNHFLDTTGQWLPGQPEALTAAKAVNLNGANLRVFETSRSGVALLAPVGATLVAFGDAEVFLAIRYTNGSGEYLSAPLTTQMEFQNVQSLELNLLYLVGNAACSSVRYRALFNAHCIFERF
jgi:hypothetical protein